MKEVSSILIFLFLIISCNNKAENKPELIRYSNYENYEKVSDTSYIKIGTEPTHRITHLKKGSENLILFKKISLDQHNNENQTILDTLSINNLNDVFTITIGYCEMTNSTPEEIIAVVEQTEKDSIQTIVKAWKANSVTGKIENIKHVNAIACLNEL